MYSKFMLFSHTMSVYNVDVNCATCFFVFCAQITLRAEVTKCPHEYKCQRACWLYVSNWQRMVMRELSNYLCLPKKYYLCV